MKQLNFTEFTDLISDENSRGFAIPARIFEQIVKISDIFFDENRFQYTSSYVFASIVEYYRDQGYKI